MNIFVFVVAIIFAGLWGSTVVLALLPHHEVGRRDSSELSSSEQEIISKVAALNRATNGTETQHQAAEKDNWKKQNLIACLALLASIVAASFAGFAFSEASSQAESARGQLATMHDQTRPWISAKFHLLKMTKTPFGIDYSFSVKLANSGTFYARYVTILALIEPVTNVGRARTMPHDTCVDYLKAWPKVRETLSRGSIFPNETMSLPEPTCGTLSFSEYRMSQASLEIAGCISYGDKDVSTVHQTEFRSIITDKVSDDGQFNMLVFPLDGPDTLQIDTSTLRVIDVGTVAN